MNFHVAAREWKDDIIFLHKILAGRSDRSYGIQVARLAGLPPSVIARARDILASLEHDELTRGGKPTISGAAPASQQQLGLFQAPATSPADEKLKDRIREVDINRTDPARCAADTRRSEEGTGRLMLVHRTVTEARNHGRRLRL